MDWRLLILSLLVSPSSLLVTVNIRGGPAEGCTGLLLTRHHVLAPQQCEGGLVNRRTTTRQWLR